MKAKSHVQMMQMIQNCVIEKYVTHDKCVELVARDKHGNKMEIKFYPNEEEQ